MSYPMSSRTTYADDLPARSRNAVAQARHRAKKKAYIEQLESTVSKLQIERGLTTEEVGVLPPASQKIRELEFENIRLRREILELRRSMQYNDSPHPHTLDGPGAHSPTSSSGGYQSDERETKRKRVSMERSKAESADPLYTMRSPRVIERVPPRSSHLEPLNIPTAYPHSYSHGNASSSSSTYSAQPPGTGYSNNSSSSSSAPSPPPYSDEVQNISRLSPAMNSRHPSLGGLHSMSSQGYSSGHYEGSVKHEDASYQRCSSYNELPPFSHMSMPHMDDNDTQWSPLYHSERAVYR